VGDNQPKGWLIPHEFYGRKRGTRKGLSRAERPMTD
jgi:hypothetical protein